MANAPRRWRVTLAQEKSAPGWMRLELRSSEWRSVVAGFRGRRFGFLLFLRIVLRGVLELLDGLTQALGERGQLGAAEEQQQDDQDDHQFGATEAENGGEGQEGEGHGSKLD